MNTSLIGRKLHKLETTGSTNRYAMQFVKKESPESGTVVMAKEQTAGRGHRDNSWESEKSRNLTFTIILKPDFLPVQRQFWLSMVISLGIFDFLKLYRDEISIKWPNDIYSGNRKIAGILIENILNSSGIEYSFAGIGININQEVFRSNAPNPVSLKILTGIEYNLDQCLELLCLKIEHWYFQLEKGELSVIKNNYTENLYRLNKLHRFDKGGKILEGRIIGVDDFGHLLIETADNKILEFDFKEISFLP